MAEIIVAADATTLATTLANWIAARIAAKQGIFRFCLSGGSTPRTLYSTLASDAFRGRIDWSKVHLYWGDERFVPHDDPDSNYRMTRETLLGGISIPDANVHPVPTDGDPDDAAGRYEAELKREYGADTLDPARPLFDVNLLGVGDDGHVASLIPGQPVLDEKKKWVASVPKGRSEMRITLTYPAIDSSAAVVFLVAGAAKAEAVRKARAGDMSLPAARVAPHGTLYWFLDEAAAGRAA